MRVGSQQKPLAAPYAGPYLVVSKGGKTFTIQVGQRQEIVSVDRLKPHTGVFMKPQSGGGPCGGSYLNSKYIYAMCVSR